MKGNDLMAEKYGDMPKRFTKKWWEYFWDYYKVHTIATVAIILAVIVTIYQVVTAPQYEFNAFYAGEYDIPYENAEALRLKMSEFITDSDGDGKDGINFNQISFVEGADDPQIESAKATRMYLEITDENSILFLVDESKAKYFFGDGELEDAFLEVEQWLLEDVGEDKLYIKNEKAYAVNLKDSKFLEELGVDSQKLYVAIRRYGNDLDEEMQEKIADAKNIANAIIK